jgi:hypothetical protein
VGVRGRRRREIDAEGKVGGVMENGKKTNWIGG